MKNQYFGDIGDYGKYGLLRHLAGQGLSISVNWYLTPDDASNDGSIRGYLSKEEDRRYDPELFDVLREMCARKEQDVCLFAKRGMIPGAIYHDDIVEPELGSPLSVPEKRAAQAVGRPDQEPKSVMQQLEEIAAAREKASQQQSKSPKERRRHDAVL